MGRTKFKEECWCGSRYVVDEVLPPLDKDCACKAIGVNYMCHCEQNNHFKRQFIGTKVTPNQRY